MPETEWGTGQANGPERFRARLSYTDFTKQNQNLVMLNLNRKKQHTNNRLQIIVNLGNGTSFGERNQFWPTPGTVIFIILKQKQKETVNYLHIL